MGSAAGGVSTTMTKRPPRNWAEIAFEYQRFTKNAYLNSDYRMA
jgi:hypothetical protein